MKQEIISHARSLGFNLVGFSPAKIEDKYLVAFEGWLEKGQEGEMSYMREIERRRDLTKTLPGARSVIVLGMNYYNEQEPAKEGHGKVARYAYGRDYHKIIGKKLKKLASFVDELAATNQAGSTPAPRVTRAYVDTGPLLERALAEQAGIGVIGKNSCLITPEFGSWVFISEIITTLDLGVTQDVSIKTAATNKSLWHKMADRPQNFPVCGNCTKCIDACPTGAIIAPGVIDSRLCISYLTIENKDKISPELAKIIKDTKQLYGCDICQEVCPHNSVKQRPVCPDSTGSPNPLSEPRIAGSQLSLEHIAALKDQDHFIQTFAGSPIVRAKHKGLTRNAKILE